MLIFRIVLISALIFMTFDRCNRSGTYVVVDYAVDINYKAKLVGAAAERPAMDSSAVTYMSVDDVT